MATGETPTTVAAASAVTPKQATESGVPTKEYRLKDGLKHYHLGVLIKPGEVVPLTPSEQLAFADKFEPV